MAIQKLPDEVRSAVRSGIAISSTAQCVTELVMNSLDAGATSVIVHLDIPHFKLEVDDNGCGITLDDLHYVGIRYHTSKCRTIQDLHNNLKYNGYRGEALASLSECCGFLVIVTRPKKAESDKTYLKTFTRGKVHRLIETDRRRNHGTTVTVQDFMCHAPVRQKRIIPNVDIEEIRIHVEGLALSHPHVSFTIIDDTDKSIVRRIPSSSSPLETFTQLFGQEISRNLHPINPYTSAKLSISGFISTSSYHNKRLQFIFVNGRLVKGTKIHKLINMIMRKSDVLRGNGPWQELPMPERMRDFLWVSPLKRKDRYCVFLVNISCPISEYDITLDPKKTLIEFSDWDTLFECIENVVKSFLKEHNLACISIDQDIANSQSSSDSPSSVINEMEQLEKEDALGQRLSHFRCPVETNSNHGKPMAPGNSILNMMTAIHSIPAKRNLGNAFTSTAFHGQNHREKEPTDKARNNVANRCSIDGGRSDNIKHDINNHAEMTEVDKLELIKFPLLPMENSTPVNSFNELNDASHQYNLKYVKDSGLGSLGRFRKTFQKTQVTFQTPEDAQKISEAEEPPPIVRRSSPLEHRIKGFGKSRTFVNIGVNTVETIFDKAKNVNVGKIKEFPTKQLKVFEFSRKMSDDEKVAQKKKCVEAPACVGNISSNNSVTSTATQTESNYVANSEQKCLEKQSLVKEGLRPNLKSLNFRRRQFMETINSHAKIKVCKYDDMNKDIVKEMEPGAISTMDLNSDHNQPRWSEFSECFVTSEPTSQNQSGTESGHMYPREKICPESLPDNKSTEKPNFKNLRLRKKYFEEASADSSNKNYVHNSTVTKRRMDCDGTAIDSFHDMNDLINNTACPKTRNESEKQITVTTFLTSADFICSAHLSKECLGNAPRENVNARSEDIAAVSPTLPQLYAENPNDPVNLNEKMLEDMPVLEPYHCSNFNDNSGNIDSDSPTFLLVDRDYPWESDFEDVLKNSSLSKEPAVPIPGTMSSDSCVTSLAKCEQSLEKANSAHEENSENAVSEVKEHIFHESNSMKIQDFVTVYHSDSKDDDSNEVHNMEIVTENFECQDSNQNCNRDEYLVDARNNAIKTGLSPCDSYDVTGGLIGSRLGAFNKQKVFDPTIDKELSKKNFPVKKTFDSQTLERKNKSLSNTSGSEVPSCPLIFHEEHFEFLNPDKYEKMALDANRTTSNIAVAKWGENNKSPFFADSSEWDDALTEMCHKIENNDCVKSISLQPERVVGANGEKNVIENISCQQDKRFEMFARPAFCPKGLSPVMPGDFPCREKHTNKLEHVLTSQEEYDLDSVIKQSSLSSDELSWIKWSNSLVKRPVEELLRGSVTTSETATKPLLLTSLLAEAQDKRLLSETEILSARIENQSKSFVKVFNLIHPCTFSKDVLSHLKMIGMLDCKFIAAKVNLGKEKSSSVVVLFDQHAVHERIRLERLTQEYQIRNKTACSNIKEQVKYKSTCVAPTFEITLNTSEARLLDSFHEHFEGLGLAYDVLSGNGKESGDTVIKINEVPACLISKELKESGPLGLKEQVHSLIREQVEHLLVTRGIGVFSPTILRDAINMKACRGAVKFGDSLSNQECRWLLRKLSACDTPFQCAHGRPSMYPIIELKQLNRFYDKTLEDSKPRLWRLKKMMECAAAQKRKMGNCEHELCD